MDSGGGSRQRRGGGSDRRGEIRSGARPRVTSFLGVKIGQELLAWLLALRCAALLLCAMLVLCCALVDRIGRRRWIGLNCLSQMTARASLARLLLVLFRALLTFLYCRKLLCLQARKLESRQRKSRMAGSFKSYGMI